MNKDIINMIKKLSKSDKKNITEQALKCAEESGELARAVLSYSGAHATMKNFIPKEKILEEVIDVCLTAYSIGYKLGYTDDEIEEMFREKTLVWADLQNRERLLEDGFPFEIHVSVKDVDKEEFKKVCMILGIKPIILDLQNNDGKSVFEDVMSSSVFIGSNATVYEELIRISKAFQRAGFNVVREKIETVPWHPAAPSQKHQNPYMPKNCYFECHFNVICSDNNIEKLKKIAKKHGAHLSKNIYKRIDDSNYKIMMTYRKYDGVYESFNDEIEKLEKTLLKNDFNTDKKIVEFSIFDTKISHDAKWLLKKK